MYHIINRILQLVGFMECYSKTYICMISLLKVVFDIWVLVMSYVL